MMRQLRAAFFSVEALILGGLAAYGFLAGLGILSW